MKYVKPRIVSLSEQYVMAKDEGDAIHVEIDDTGAIYVDDVEYRRHCCLSAIDNTCTVLFAKDDLRDT